MVSHEVSEKEICQVQITLRFCAEMYITYAVYVKEVC